MSEENKEEQKRGQKGETGIGSASTRLKSLWKKNAKSKEPLKEFVARMIKENNAPASVDGQHWFDAKLGKFEEKRSDKNVARIQLEKQASKSSRK
jgi:hypothetical protein